MKETADIDTSNNFWGTFSEPSKFQVFKDRQQKKRSSCWNGKPNASRRKEKLNQIID
jgi:hypothetical protein